MFKDNINTIRNTFLEFKGSGMYIALFLFAIVYIYIKEDNKKIKSLLVYSSIVILFLTLNPIFNKLVGSVFTPAMYWRVYWMIPIGITIAYGSVKLINETDGKFKKITATVLVIIAIMFSGKLMYNKENFVKLGNWYKLPDEDVLVAQLIGTDGGEYKKALAPRELNAHIRQIDSNIMLCVARDPEGKENESLTALNSGNVNWVVTVSKKTKSNYVVFKKETVLTENMENYGYKKINETENYAIYKDMEFSE